jgi:hypothetical protein
MYYRIFIEVREEDVYFLMYAKSLKAEPDLT